MFPGFSVSGRHRFSYTLFESKTQIKALIFNAFPIFGNSHPVPVKSKNLTGSSIIHQMAFGIGSRLDGSLAQRCGVRISFGRLHLFGVDPF